MRTRHYGIPPLSIFGKDLTTTTAWQRRFALARPLIGVGLYVLAIALGLWWMTPLIVFLIFVAVVTVTHDVVHRSLGLSERATEWALFFMGAVLLESGHAYRCSHLQHHAVFPGPDDPEGDPARMPLWKVLLWGPVFLLRLWLWAFRRRRNNTKERVWLVAEAAWGILVIATSLVLLPITPWVAAYVLMALVGSWVYPLLTVHLPHRNYGETPLTQTHTLRGRIIPSLFLELTYHLEHHLYPEVPAHNLRRLSTRMDPYFAANRVRPIKVP